MYMYLSTSPLILRLGWFENIPYLEPSSGRAVYPTDDRRASDERVHNVMVKGRLPESIEGRIAWFPPRVCRRAMPISSNRLSILAPGIFRSAGSGSPFRIRPRRPSSILARTAPDCLGQVEANVGAPTTIVRGEVNGTWDSSPGEGERAIE